jgi:hypothetical protein
MSLEIDVLRALLRLARRRTHPTLDQLVVRVGAEESEVRRALFALARGGLVQRTPAGLRLSLLGLAVAVASAQRPKPALAAERIVASRLAPAKAAGADRRPNSAPPVTDAPLPLIASAASAASAASVTRTTRRTRRAA